MCAQQISVLVVEDEPLIRMNIATEMADDGLIVLEASNALEAIAILEQQAPVDVIFTDIDMPGETDGLALARMARSFDPTICLILTSGRRQLDDHDLPEGIRFFPKPYVAATIIRTINEIAGSE